MQTADSTREQSLDQFYALLHELAKVDGGPRNLSTCTGSSGWPRRGIYFFFEPGEIREHKVEELRVVRVGTHALKEGSSTSLWNRLSQHRGPVVGPGNHRGSIFRLLIGKSILIRTGRQCETWGVGSSAPRETREKEHWLEAEVSEYIGRLPFLWLDIDDAAGPTSMRGLIERNSIALLSNYLKPSIDPHSPEWLGSSSDRVKVRDSGLWNSNHVDETFNPAFLGAFEQLISLMRRAK